MPVPAEYLNSTKVIEKFMVDARDSSGLNTTNMAYNMVVGVLHTFRKRLDIKAVLFFADVLPPPIRALFIAEWDPYEPKIPFADRVQMTKEVQSLRQVHNWSPDSSIRDVAEVLRRNLHVEDFERVLSVLSPAAQNCWRV